MFRHATGARAARAGLPLLLLLLLAPLPGCDGLPLLGSDGSDAPADVEVQAESASLFPGEDVRVAALVRSSSGAVLQRPFWVETYWTTSDDSVAMVNGDRLVALRPGAVTLRGSVAGVMGELSLDVRHRVRTLELSGGRDWVYEGDTVRYSVIARGWQDEQISDVPLAWRSSAAAAVEFGTGNSVIARQTGSPTLTASVADVFRAAPIEATVRLGVEAVAVTRVAGAYAVQAVQRTDGSVPLVAGRPAALRIFPVAAPALLHAAPRIRVDLYDDTGLFDSFTLSRGSAGVPSAVQEGALDASWNVLLTAQQVRPGLRILVHFDPDNEIRVATASTKRLPANGVPMPLPVRVTPPFRARFVPVHQPVVGGPSLTPANMDAYLAETLRLLPIGEYDVDIREPYFTSVRLNSDANWQQVLSEIAALRLADGSSRHYHGIGRRDNGGPAGIAYLGYPTALSYDQLPAAAGTIAHEFGHNFGLLHSPCGNPAMVEPAYPHANGATGAWGLDLTTNTLHPPTSNDLMGYCHPRWISAFNFERVLALREQATWNTRAAAASQHVLLLWGSVGPSGELRLEPGVRLHAPAFLPERAGAHTLEGLDEAGATLFSFSFDAQVISEGPADVAHFAFAVPIDAGAHERLERLRLRSRGRTIEQRASAGAARRSALAAGRAEPDVTVAPFAGGTRIRWNAREHPLLVVRNPRTGSIISFARGGDVVVRTAADELELHLSDGVSSASRRRRIR